jgi:hypothetical protein
MLRKPIAALLCTVACGILALLAARSQAQESEIKGGISATVIKVDVARGTVTVADKNSRERTYSINEETVIVGPRGGVVHRRLKDPRFHNGLPITIVANGTTAAELHLGYDRKGREGTVATTPSTSRPGTRPAPPTDNTPNDASPSTPAAPERRTARFRGLGSQRGTPAAKPAEEEDEDNEFPGKIKSVDPARHMLVITLVNGKDRSFLLASDVKVMINTRTSRKGLSDAALQPGMPLTVITEPGGRKVKEVKVSTTTRRLPKAG